jgi:hypothetical protein
MSAEAILENPALFANLTPDLDNITLEYLTLADKYSSKLKQAKSHVMKFLYSSIST